jgi:hypothetical protein
MATHASREPARGPFFLTLSLTTNGERYDPSTMAPRVPLAPASSPPWRAVTHLLGVAALVAACADSPKPSEIDSALAQLRSAEPAKRHEAVVRLGLLPPSEARRDGLAAAVRDSDSTVRLLAAIAIVGDGPTGLEVSLRPPPPPTADPSRTPNPSRAILERPLSPAESLVHLDPWFAGTLLPGALRAAQDGDERVRTLGQRALKELKPSEPPNGSTQDAGGSAESTPR